MQRWPPRRGRVFASCCAPSAISVNLPTASFGGRRTRVHLGAAWDIMPSCGVPSLFNANKLYPLPNALAYGEHLFGISLFTLPVYALTRNPVLAYNVVWILCYLLTAAVPLIALGATPAIISRRWLPGWRSRFVLSHAPRPRASEPDLVLLIPLSFVAISNGGSPATWTRSRVGGDRRPQALATWYQRC